jgi:hypothetical protein
MLREFGVKGVKVQEVVSLDDELMAFLKYDSSSDIVSDILSGVLIRKKAYGQVVNQYMV